MKRLSLYFFAAILAGIVVSCTSHDKEPDSGFIIDGMVTDVCGNKYKVITVGGQTWMAENMRCDTYDTQSEKAGEKIKYVDARNRSLWGDVDCVNLTDEQVSKFGYLYDQDYIKPKDSNSKNIQSICPNGWHIPTSYELSTLVNYGTGNASIYDNFSASGDDGYGAKKLKSVEGWYACDDKLKRGDDLYSFNLLPSGWYNGKNVVDVGLNATFMIDVSQVQWVKYDKDGFPYSKEHLIGAYHSVRCVKNGASWFEAVNWDMSDVYFYEIYVYTNCEYSVTTDRDWLKYEIIKGPFVINSVPWELINVTHEPNLSDTKDEGHINVKASDGSSVTYTIYRNPSPKNDD